MSTLYIDAIAFICPSDPDFTRFTKGFILFIIPITLLSTSYYPPATIPYINKLMPTSYNVTTDFVYDGYLYFLGFKQDFILLFIFSTPSTLFSTLCYPLVTSYHLDSLMLTSYNTSTAICPLYIYFFVFVALLKTSLKEICHSYVHSSVSPVWSSR
jgi:hypothetical protein